MHLRWSLEVVMAEKEITELLPTKSGQGPLCFLDDPMTRIDEYESLGLDEKENFEGLHLNRRGIVSWLS